MTDRLSWRQTHTPATAVVLHPLPVLMGWLGLEEPNFWLQGMTAMIALTLTLPRRLASGAATKRGSLCKFAYGYLPLGLGANLPYYLPLGLGEAGQFIYFDGPGWIRTSVGLANGFTVRPH